MKPSYALGLFFIVSVSIIWSAASILVQYLYQGLDFDSPFLLTYIGTSLLTVLIPMFILTNEGCRITVLWNYCCCCFTSMGIMTGTQQDDEITTKTENDFGTTETMTHSRPPPSSTFMKLATIPSTEGTPLSIHVNSDNDDDGHPQSQSQDETFNYDQDEEIVPSSPERLQRQPLNNDGDGRNDSGSMNGEEEDHFYYDYQSNLLSHRDHIEMAMKVAPFWFISNYFYNLSLQYTTIT